MDVRRRARTHDPGGVLSLARMQQLAGNAAVASMVQRAPGAPPAPGLIQRKVGWSDASTAGRGWNVGEKSIGGVRRLPLEGLSEGVQTPKTKKPVQLKDGSWTLVDEGTELKELSSESAQGKAIVLIPAALDPAKGVELIIHLHGYTESTSRPFAGFRTLDGSKTKTKNEYVGKLRQGVDARTAKPTDTAPVRDVALDEAEQQLGESGQPQVVIVLPQGGLHSAFGKGGGFTFNSDTYARQVVDRIQGEHGWLLPGTDKAAEGAPALTRVSMSGHSGAGATLAAMARQSVADAKAPARSAADPSKPAPETSGISGDLVLFDAINGSGQLKAFQDWASMRLEQDRAAIKAATTDDQKLAYVRSAQKLRAYWSTGAHGGTYVGAYAELKKPIDKWFRDNAADLGPIAGYLSTNYSFTPIAVGHEELMRGSLAGEDRPAGKGGILDAVKGLEAAAPKSMKDCPPLPAERTPPAAKPKPPPKPARKRKQPAQPRG